MLPTSIRKSGDNKLKKKLNKLIACVLVACMVFGTVVYAGGSGGTSLDPEEQGKLSHDASDGFTGGSSPIFGYRMGLSRCVNEELHYDLSDQNAKAVAVQEYNAKYYMRPEGETVVMPISGSSSVTANYRGSDSIPAGSAPACITATLTEIVNKSPSRYTTIGSNGAISIPPDEAIVTELMEAFATTGPINAGMVEQWKQEKYSLELASHPVVICIEVVGLVVEGGKLSWWSASDYAYRMGCGTKLLSTDLTQYSGSSVSMTCNAIAQMCGYSGGTSKGDNWPYRFTKRFFNCSYKNKLHGPSSGYADLFGDAASMAWATFTDQHLGVNGCTVVAIGGDLEGIHGSYTWHINASRLPETAEGYREDNVADAEGDKNIGVGAVNIKQSNVAQWQEWIMKHGGPFTIDIQKYWTVGGNFSVQYNEVVGQRISSSTNTLSSAATEKKYTVDANTLFDYL